MIPTMGGRLFSIICSMTFLVIAHNSNCAFAEKLSPEQFAGEWRQTSIGGTTSWGNRPCHAYEWTERILLLVEVPGSQSELRGTWTRRESIEWMRNDPVACAQEENRASGLFQQASVTFALRATINGSTGAIDLHGKFANCSGALCPIFASNQIQSSPQQFSMQLVNGKLIDAGSPNQQVIFERTADVEEQSLVVERVWRKILQDLETKTIDRVLEEYSSADPSPSIDNKLLSKDALERIAGRSTQVGLYATSAWLNPTSQGPFALFANIAIATSRGGDRTQILEYVLLRREGDQWKIASILHD